MDPKSIRRFVLGQRARDCLTSLDLYHVLRADSEEGGDGWMRRFRYMLSKDFRRRNSTMIRLDFRLLHNPEGMKAPLWQPTSKQRRKQVTENT